MHNDTFAPRFPAFLSFPPIPYSYFNKNAIKLNKLFSFTSSRETSLSYNFLKFIQKKFGDLEIALIAKFDDRSFARWNFVVFGKLKFKKHI